MSTPRHVQLADVIEVIADAVGDRRVLITNEVSLTYAELDERATRLANHLAANGVRTGDHVGIHARNRAEWVESFYGCFKIRAVPVNVNYRYVAAELRYLYDNSDCVAVIVEEDFVDAVDEVSDALPDLRHRLVMGDEYESALAEASPERDFEERSEDDIYLVYTGGTTGMPKGVMWRHEDLILGALNSYRFGAPLDRVEQLAEEASGDQYMTLMTMGPLMHGGSQWAMGNVHVAGGTAVLYTKHRFDAHEVLAMAVENGANSLTVIGDAMARPIADALSEPDRPDYDLSALMAISNGGAPLSVGVRQQLNRALPDMMIVDSYGSSETGATGTNQSSELHSTPRFQTGPETTVLDPETKRVCGPGEVGMLARSGHIPLGYYKDPDKTAETFPEVDGKRWVIPGDFARIEDDGSISILGRGSVSINSGGEKIFPEEVESALTQHQRVFDAAVVGTPSERWGQQVTALVQRREGADLSAEDLREHCRDLIAGYKIPKDIIFVDSVPRTPVGKVDYKASAALAHAELGVAAT